VAATDTAATDTAVLTLNAKLDKALKKGGVKTTAVKPATLRGRAVTLPAVMDGAVVMSGGIVMRNGANLVKISKIVIDPSRGQLDAEVVIKDPAQPNPMSFPVEGLMRVSGGTNHLAEHGTWTNATLTLSRRVTVTGLKLDPATLLGNALGVSIKSGAVFGSITISVTP
jgi:hypothetical protein